MLSTSYEVATTSPIAKQLIISQAIDDERLYSSDFFMKDYTQDLTEFQCLVLTVYHEAKGEPRAGRKAVAFVIHNRVEKSIRSQDKGRIVPWGTSFCETVFQDKQFSFIADRWPDNIKDYNAIKKIADMCYDLMYNGGFTLKKSPVGKAYFFNSLESPYDWVYNHEYEYVTTIGNHHFYGFK